MPTETQTRKRAATRRTTATRRAATQTTDPVQINTEDIAQLEAGRMIVISQLEEALGDENAAAITLRAHWSMAPEGPYRKLLERHIDETSDQADRLRQRLDELGANRSPVAVGYAAATSVVGQAFALTKGPIDALRGRAGEEKLFKNAKDEIATEAAEIATYDGLEATARAVGDVKTAELAASIREQEEAQLQALRRELPVLAFATVRSLAAGDPSFDISDTGAAQVARELRDEVVDEAEELRDDAKGTAKQAQRTAKSTAGDAKRTTRRTAASTRSRARSSVNNAAEKAKV
jgi:ferritin-like metal-binding protein YciE